MNAYKHILAAIDLNEEASEVLNNVRNLARLYDARWSVVSVIRPLTYGYTGIETATLGHAVLNFEVEAQVMARKRLAELCAEVPEDRRHVLIGSPAVEVRACAKAIGADLIVIGSHGQHGLGLILGSTANGVLHGSPCDVLTIRIK